MGEREGPLVSVVIPTYNRPERVKRAVDSVTAQTYEPIELVVVDDCSDTPVEEYLGEDHARRFERFDVLRHDENRGGSAARNTGLQNARGEYIGLLDDDDRWKPENVERQVETFRENDVGVVTSGAEVADENGTIIKRNGQTELPSEPPTLTKQLLCRNVIGSCSTVMVDSEVVDVVGTFDERFPSWQDQEWLVRLSQHYRFGAVTEPLLIYNRHSSDRISENLDALENETYPLFLEKFRPVAAEYGPVFERKMRAWAAYRVGKQLVLAGRVRDGRRFLTRSMRLYPFETTFYKHGLPALGGPPTYEAARKTKRTLDRIQ